MKFLLSLFLLILGLGGFLSPLQALDPTQQELDARRVWVAEKLGGANAAFPFSFVYDGRPSQEFLASWFKEMNVVSLDENRVQRTLTFIDPQQQLQITCRSIEYLDFPSVEWVLHFKNISEADTRIISNIQAIDTTFRRDVAEIKPIDIWDPNFGYVKLDNHQREFLLHTFAGAPAKIDDYTPTETELPQNAAVSFAPGDGRPLFGAAPYYNIQANKKGWIVVLGWPGQWRANFQRVGELDLHVTGGQELTHFKLLPGEEIRTPMAVVQPWIRESWYDAQNVWRAWMIKHNIPKQKDGSIVTHHIGACSSHFFAEMTQANTECQKYFIDRYLEEGIPLDYWWMDAGWYPCEDVWLKTGTWEVDQTRFPGGFRPITDHGRSKGVKSIVWFEPERVGRGAKTWITENHLDWVINGEQGDLVNFSKPEVVDWAIDHFDAFIKREGVDLYRQDFNTSPLGSWRCNDAPDRQGITEAKHVVGYLRYWDALLERNSDLRIDSTAAGGNRNELESMRRGVPLLRSDYILEAVGNQNHTYGISLWIPFHGTGLRAFDDYGFRSIMVPYFNLCYDMRNKDSDYENIRKNIKIWNDVIVPVYGADYYPLTEPAPFRDDVWLGWQFNDPKAGRGAIQMFRRLNSSMTQGVFKLHGLEPDALYAFSDVDSQEFWSATGQELMTEGVMINIEKPLTALIISYKRVDGLEEKK